MLHSTTNAAGSTFTSTIEKTILLPPTQLPGSDSANTSSHSSSHTGAIVGGVVGGIGGLIALIVIAYFLLKRRRRDEFDGDFDPDKVTGGRLPHGMDLAGEGAEVTPYQYTPAGAQMSQSHNASLVGGLAGVGAAGLAAGSAGKGGQPPPSAYRNGPPTSVPSQYSQPSVYGGSSSSEGGQPMPSRSSHQQNRNSMYDPQLAYAAAYSDHSGGGSDPATSSHNAFPGGFYDPNQPNFRHPSPGPSLPTTGSTLPSQKELEARGLRVANSPGPSEGSSGGVVQHLDGGRVMPDAEESQPPNEIPPAYDSIRDR